MQPLHTIIQKRVEQQSMFFYVRGAVAAGMDPLPAVRQFVSEFLPECLEAEESLYRRYYEMLGEYLNEKEVFKPQ